MHNFAKTKMKKQRSRKKNIFLGTSIFIIVFCLLLAIWAAVNINTLKVVYSESLAAKQSFEYAQADLSTMNFAQAKKNLDEADAHFALANKKFKRFKVFKIFPGVRQQIKAVENMLQAGENLASGTSTLVGIANDTNSLVSGGNKSFGEISADQKREVLKKLYESNSDLQGVKSEIELAEILIEEIPDEGLLAPIQEAVVPVKEQLPLLESVIHQAIPIVQAIPIIAGYPEQKECLIVLQNNYELRPTGGFAGTVGELHMNAGEIANLYTENVYVFDDPFKDKITEPAPLPIQQQTHTAQAFLRNENWWPDFPTSARKMRDKFIFENGNPNTSCVIAINIPFIIDLMKMVGPIQAGDTLYNEENLFAALQEEVEFGYYEKGIDAADRKDVIADIGSKMVKKFFALPQSELPKIWELFKTNAEEKHIQFYYDDEIVEDLLREMNWAGEMQSYDNGDYLMFVDANVSALKTDEVMERELSYKVYEEDGQMMGEAQMLYRNNGSFTKIHTRYRTYTRIYLPHGAALVDYDGFLTGDKIQNGVPVAPETTDETVTRPDGSTVTYSVVEGFTAIEPGQEGTLRIKYKLPENVVQQIRNNTYSVYIQKQAGTLDNKLDFSFDVGKPIERADALDLTPEIIDNRVSVASDLRIDRRINIVLK